MPADQTSITLGDLGYLDADGCLYLSSRTTDLFISGGVNIYPQEIEDALVMHPDVADAAVFGVVDDEMGQRVFAGEDRVYAGPRLPSDKILRRTLMATYDPADSPT
ncbi:non-ribosomal peptide synthetase component E (peptide arylation enzyme) [Williamsia sp. R60]